MCFVPGCTSRFNSKDGEKRVLFYMPKDEDLLSKWKRAIPRSSSFMTRMSKVCDLHFEEDAVIKTKTTIVDGKETVVPRTRWALKEGAIPTKFPSILLNYVCNKLVYSFMFHLDCPAYLTKRTVMKRSPMERTSSTVVKKKKVVDDTTEVTHIADSASCERQENVIDTDTPMVSDCTSNLTFPVTNTEVPIALPEVSLPGETWAVMFTSHLENTAYIYEAIVFNGAPTVRKCVVIDILRKQLEFRVFNKVCTMEDGFPHHFLTIQDLQLILHKFNSASVCEGIKDEIYHPLQFSQIRSGVFNDGVWNSTE